MESTTLTITELATAFSKLPAEKFGPYHTVGVPYMQIKRLPYDPDAGDEVVQPVKLAVLFK